MTTTYDPKHPKYLDEADVRDELTRVYDLCHGCRLCFKFCTSFPTLFEMIDRHDDQDAGRLTPAQQDQVVDECFQCKLCYINCPYIPELHEWALDFPRLMLRADAMRHANRSGVGCATAATNTVMGHTDLMGKAATLAAPLANKMVGAKPGSHRAQGHREGHRRVERAAAAAVRPPAVHHLVQEAPEGAHRQAPGPRRRVPHLPRRVPAAADRPRPGEGLRAQRHRVLARRGRRLLRRPVAAQRRRRAVHQGRREERRRRWPPRCARATTSSCRSPRAATS